MNDPLISRCGYVTFGVTEIEPTLAMLRDFCHMDVTETRDGEAFLSAGDDHYWVRLVKADKAAVVRVGFEAASDAAFDQIVAALDKHGISHTSNDDALAADRVDRWIRFVDPSGIEVEVYGRMVDRPGGPRPSQVQIKDLVHAVFMVTDVPATTRFYEEVLGFRVSDWIEQGAVFMRCGIGYHHSLAFFKGKNPGELAHICVLAEDLDSLMTVRRRALDGELGLHDDLVCHAASGSPGFYLRDPHSGLVVEFCINHPRVNDETHQSRILPRGGRTHDIWRMEHA